MSNLSKLIREYQILKSRIKSILHGSIEIRERNNNKYIYVRYRDGAISTSKYVGVYSEELINVITNNNFIVAQYKKQLKDIKKELKKIQYETSELTDAVKLNIDFARRNLVESIYKQAILEGVATTYSNTETIIEGGKVKNMTSKDISKIINLKHAWEFILEEGVITYPTNFNILCEINAIVEDGFSYTAGKIRSLPVKFGGSSCIPPLPFESQVKNDLDDILSNEVSYDVAIELLLYVMKKQLFLDGNKRTAVILANHYLVSKGLGLIVVPEELVKQFKKHLIDYYEEKNDGIKDFLKIKCLLKI